MFRILSNAGSTFITQQVSGRHLEMLPDALRAPRAPPPGGSTSPFGGWSNTGLRLLRAEGRVSETMFTDISRRSPATSRRLHGQLRNWLQNE